MMLLFKRNFSGGAFLFDFVSFNKLEYFGNVY